MEFVSLYYPWVKPFSELVIFNWVCSVTLGVVPWFSILLLLLVTLPISMENALTPSTLMMYIFGPFCVNCYPSHHYVMLILRDVFNLSHLNPHMPWLSISTFPLLNCTKLYGFSSCCPSNQNCYYLMLMDEEHLNPLLSMDHLLSNPIHFS